MRKGDSRHPRNVYSAHGEPGPPCEKKEAFQSIYSVYGQFANTLAATFAANVKQASFYAKTRNYASSRAYYLAENEVPESVYDNLVAAIQEGLPLLHDYVAVRKNAGAG